MINKMNENDLKYIGELISSALNIELHKNNITMEFPDNIQIYNELKTALNKLKGETK